MIKKIVHSPKSRTFGEKKLGQWSYLKITISTKSLISIPFTLCSCKKLTYAHARNWLILMRETDLFSCEKKTYYHARNRLTVMLETKVYTVRSFAPICSSTTSTLFSEHFSRQSHTGRNRKMKRKSCSLRLLGSSWLLQEQYASLHFHAMIGRQGWVVVRQIFILGLSCTGGIPWFFFVLGGITSCGSASLKHCVCKAASPWS